MNTRSWEKSYSSLSYQTSGFKKLEPHICYLFANIPLMSSKLNSTGQFPKLLTMLIAAHTFLWSSLEVLIMHSFVIGFTYFTAPDMIHVERS